ncbi:ComEA family DNA-binding protein [Amphritea sp. 2_MG-2023]|jgi:competence protein ComEA|uniref:ComEA family DNA-binding protein n=1 Tax=Amphritea TaxID=515417 RepID=UPI001C072CB5|nr:MULTISPECIES: ComEA family DNA-binding protein [Amphritea]MBU2965128.1 helix-hairpin-helix domain-containing protein [Amphritea atlantica]MDO6418913.1 ComEA family DNA-binding protein [Amphritea sp. 2_MG-2023]MDX2423724.1 ComEA family DNA-binding protein [Amphritea sp.]
MKWTSCLKSLLLLLCLSLPLGAFAEPMVNINTASADTLAEVLQGVGPAKAKAIIEYRETNGPFKTIDELANVRGIGDATVAKNLQSIAVEDPQ